ncbi:energy transducer TonB [Pseudoalteromonas sp. A757]|uniref:energy transducer TonB n=1 Tax=Pseudoalteromonas sp. A757 TaxID=2250709 RepID=UPI000FFE676E|nr:energy transducer TonB [Pseudoalteromonas sp. A757]RXE88592.1 energy transducer TonB [Pseudoalteromonas sp. A757]
MTTLTTFKQPNSTILKLAFSFAGAIVITFATFSFMQNLVSQELTRPIVDIEVFDLTIATDKEDSPVAEKNTRPEPPKPMVAPVRPVENIVDTGNNLQISNEAPDINLGKFTNTMTLKLNTDGQATPLVRSNPNYPPAAARDGVEGWVEMEFTISPQGEVFDVRVTNAEPKRVFNQAAIRALRKWKYRPLIVDGKPQSQYAQRVVLEFTLQQ